MTGVADRTDRPGRRRPFSTWMRKLANFKNSSSIDANQVANGRRHTYQMKSQSKKQVASKNNNPYPESGFVNGNSTGAAGNHRSFSTVPTGGTTSTSSLNRSRPSASLSEDGHELPIIGNKSSAPTMSTDGIPSDAAPSQGASSAAGTSATVGGGMGSGRGDSTFSSPAPSVQSLTTTLTTMHSAAPPAPASSHNTTSNNTQSIQFSHQFPTSPLHALPAHLAPQGSGGHPATYNTATANNLLTDNASILTLASSSKRRRRRSMDTDASVRALAPSSLFGGSRESLPLSVLSANVDSNTVPTPTPHQTRHSVGGLNERASIYSATGVAPALPSERNSYYAGKQSAAADGGSVRSGLLGHGRNDSISGSIGGGLAGQSSPLASPRDAGILPTGNLSRTNSAWGETDEKGEDDAGVEADEGEKA